MVVGNAGSVVAEGLQKPRMSKRAGGKAGREGVAVGRIQGMG